LHLFHAIGDGRPVTTRHVTFVRCVAAQGRSSPSLQYAQKLWLAAAMACRDSSRNRGAAVGGVEYPLVIPIKRRLKAPFAITTGSLSARLFRHGRTVQGN